MKKDRKFFYGWWVVVVITTMFIIGNAAPFAIVLKQLMEQFHTGRGEISLSQSISMIAMAITGIFVGRILHRHKPRTFLLWGSVLGGVSALLTSLANGIWFIYAFSLITGLAGGFANAIAMFTLLSKWFTRKWGTALGITMAGGSIGAMLMQPLMGIIAQNFGWRVPYLVMGLLILIVNVPLVLFVFKDSPESLGLLADGDKSKEVTSSPHAQPLVQTTPELTPATNKTNLLVYLKSPSLWLMGFCFAIMSIGSSAVTTHEVSFITDMKVSETIAALARGITLGVGAIAALVSGWLTDRLISRYVVILFLFFAIAGMLILLHADTMSEIWVFVAIYGLGNGVSGTLLPIVTRDIFGVTNFSALFGFAVVFLFAGNAIGVPLAGFMFDATGSYHSVFMITTVLYGVAVLGIYFAFGVHPKPLRRVSIPKKGIVD